MYDGERHNTTVQQSVEAPYARPWLDEIDKPEWMADESSLYDDSWILIDDNPSTKPRPIDWVQPLYDPITERVSLLTDPENAELLEVAQKFCINLRNGNVSSIDSMPGQYMITSLFLNFLAWMRLQLVSSINDLKPSHFRRFVKQVHLGWGHLLDAESRLECYVSRLKQSGKTMPVRHRTSTDKKLVIDANQAYYEIGLHPGMSKSLGHNFITMFWRAALELNGVEQLETDSREKAERDLVEGPSLNTTSSHKKYPALWQRLYEMGYVMPQKLGFNPSEAFVPGEVMNPTDISREAMKLAAIEDCEGMTETIPDLQAFHLIDRAIRWVLMYSEDLIRLRREATEALKERTTTYFEGRKVVIAQVLDSAKVSFSPSDPGAPWPLETVRSPAKSENLSLNNASGRLLMAACAIVITAFTARRRGEVLGIKGGEPTDEDKAPRAIHIDENDEPWLWCWIEKTLQKWDRIPIPQVVVKAVEVLEELTAETRVKSGRRSLFELLLFDGDEVHDFEITKYINEFAAFVEVPPLEDGSKWVFKSHQFRRLFSLIFMYRYNYGQHGKFEALSYHLRHFSLEMTKRYIEEIKESDMLKAHREHMVTDLMSEVLRGKRKASGPAGDDLKQQLDDMLKEVIKGTKVLSGDESPVVARKIAEMVMDKLQVEMVPFLWGYCVSYKNFDGERFQGLCIKQGKEADGPNIGRATAKKCYGCEHLYVDEHFQPYWDTGSKQNQECIDSPNVSDPLKDLARKNLDVFNGGMEQYFARSTEVTHD